MKSSLLFILPVFLYFAISISCGPRNPSPTQEILGKWNMEQVFDSGDDVTSEHNPEDDRWIKFKPNQTFESGGESFGSNTGSWQFNKDESEIFLDSDAGEEDDSTWEVEFRNELMIWKGIHSDFASRFEIWHSKD